MMLIVIFKIYLTIYNLYLMFRNNLVKKIVKIVIKYYVF